VKLDDELEMSIASRLDYTDNLHPDKYRVRSFNQIGPFIDI